MVLQTWVVGAIRALRWWLARTYRRRGLHVHVPPVPCNNGCGRAVRWSTGRRRARRRGRRGQRRVYCSVACRDEKRALSVVSKRHSQQVAAAAAAGRPAPPPPPELVAAGVVVTDCPKPWKMAFPDEASATAHFVDLLRVDPGLAVYECRCGLWHAGHTPGSPRPRAHWTPPALTADVASSIDPEVAAMLRALLPPGA